jgi:Protein kinase domain
MSLERQVDGAKECGINDGVDERRSTCGADEQSVDNESENQNNATRSQNGDVRAYVDDDDINVGKNIVATVHSGETESCTKGEAATTSAGDEKVQNGDCQANDDNDDAVAVQNDAEKLSALDTVQDGAEKSSADDEETLAGKDDEEKGKADANNDDCLKNVVAGSTLGGGSGTVTGGISVNDAVATSAASAGNSNAVVAAAANEGYYSSEDEDGDDDDENAEDEGQSGYRKGGYHPVRVGEVYRGRYKIVRKLGWGHFSTVWLAVDLREQARIDEAAAKAEAESAAAEGGREVESDGDEKAPAASSSAATPAAPAADVAEQKSDADDDDDDDDTAVVVVGEKLDASDESKRHLYVALKIVKSAPHYTEAAIDEISILKVIAKRDPRRTKCVVCLLDDFKHRGPNGVHVSMVFEVLGKNLYELLKKREYRGLPLPIVQRIAKQVLVGLDYLHTRCNIIHTDLKVCCLASKRESKDKKKNTNDCRLLFFFFLLKA